MSLDRDYQAFAPLQSQALPISHRPRELNRFVEIQPHFSRRVSVGTKSNRDSFLKRELENFPARINFTTILPQSGGVQLDRTIVLLRRIQKHFVKRRAVAIGPV